MRRSLTPALWAMTALVSMLAAGAVPMRAAPPPARPTVERVLMDEMTMTEVRDAIASGKTTVLLFNGSTEQTGPHVVLGKHNFKARYLGERMARELGNALVAPLMPFAPTGAELMKFPGTIDLTAETFSRVNEEVTASLVNAGFRHVILMGDHGGNQAPLQALAPRLDERYRSRGVRVFFAGDSYAKADAEIEAYLQAHGFPPSNHGGGADTSELWAISAAYVRPDKIAIGDPVSRGPNGAVIGPTGVEGDPRRSSPALGKIFDDIKVKHGVDEIRRLIAAGAPGSLPAQSAPPPAAIANKLDTPQARVYVATLLPRTPARSPNGHATNRVLVYLDDGVMTRQDDHDTQTIAFHRGDVRWRPASGAYVAENTSDHPIRILEIDLKGPPAGQARVSQLDPTVVDKRHYKVDLENDQVRVLRVHYDAHDTGALHEHLLNRVVVYLNDQPGAKADDVRMSGPATHTEQNASDQPADRIAVEIK